jgi:hypothetical protein
MMDLNHFINLNYFIDLNYFTTKYGSYMCPKRGDICALYETFFSVTYLKPGQTWRRGLVGLVAGPRCMAAPRWCAGWMDGLLGRRMLLLLSLPWC